MASLFDDLNPEQAAAVAVIQGPLCVVAGAGSGKTRVITRRIANLIAHEVPARKILGVTFTNKAAREMHDRVVGLVGGEAPLLATFHGFAGRILRVHAETIGLRRDFTIYDREESVEVMKQAAAAAGLPDDFASPYAILEHLSAQRNSRPGVHVPWPTRVWRTFEEDLARTQERYEGILRDSNALDFDDLLIHAVEVLETSDEARDAWRRRFAHVLVDEFQDTNWHQYRLARILTEENRNLCVTGDPDQSIYTWRGADPRNFADFRDDYPEAREIVLAQNYRSTGAILRCASNVMAPASGRVHKQLWSKLGEGEPVTVLRFGNDREEAAEISDMAARWIRDGDCPAREIAILFRINALTLPFERELLGRRIPYRVVGGPSFFLRAEVRDLLAYVRVLANPLDASALMRILNVPRRGIGDKTREALALRAAEKRVPLSEIVARRDWPPVPRRTVEALDGFADLLGDLSSLPPAPVARVLQTVIADTGYAEWRMECTPRNTALDPLRNVEQLLSFAQDFDRANQGTIAEFLEGSALLTDADRDADDEDRVTLLTIHAAKGLEYDSVVVVGLEDDLLPHATSATTPEEIDEERRLLHVAMTRAKRRLVLTCAASRRRFGRDVSSTPSRFLGDLGEEGVVWQGAGSMAGRSGPPGTEVEMEEDPDNPLFHLKPGSLVRHPEYGMGRVQHLRGRQRGLDAIVTLRFEDGNERAFTLRYASLTVLEGDAEF